jgi:hypothetical protein
MGHRLGDVRPGSTTLVPSFGPSLSMVGMGPGVEACRGATADAILHRPPRAFDTLRARSCGNSSNCSSARSKQTSPTTRRANEPVLRWRHTACAVPQADIGLSPVIACPIAWTP